MIPTILHLFLLATGALCIPLPPSAPSSLTKRQDGSPFSDGVSLLSTINNWRSAYGKSSMTWSPDMASAAANTGSLNGGGVTMEHHVPPNAAEVIAPGNDNDMGIDLKGHSPFEISFIAWLCEVPGDPELGNACADQESVMNM